MKRIAILSDKFPPNPCGGIGSANYSLYKMFKSKGYEVKVFTYLENQKELSELKAESDILRFGPSSFEEKCLAFNNILKRKIRKWILRRDFEKGLAYQLNLVKLANYGSRKINKHLKIFSPDFVFISDFGAPGYSLKKISGAIYFHFSHHNPSRFVGNPLLDLHSESDAIAAVRYEQLSLKIIDKVICPSQYMKNIFKNTFSFNKEILFLPNLIDEKFINGVVKKDIHRILCIDPSWPIVYIPSASSKLKGEQFVIEIIRRISHTLENKVGFYLSGDLSEIQKFELSYFPYFHIYSPGKVNLETNISYIKDCNLLISPTLIECFGMAILESQFCNIPCIAFDVGGNEEIIKDNNGFLIRYLDIESLIAKSIEIIQNEELNQTLARNTKITQKRYSTETVFSKYLDLLK